MKTLDLWRGTIIHEGIENFLIPALRDGGALPWDEITVAAVVSNRREAMVIRFFLPLMQGVRMQWSSAGGLAEPSRLRAS